MPRSPLRLPFDFGTPSVCESMVASSRGNTPRVYRVPRHFPIDLTAARSALPCPSQTQKNGGKSCFICITGVFTKWSYSNQLVNTLNTSFTEVVVLLLPVQSRSRQTRPFLLGLASLISWQDGADPRYTGRGDHRTGTH